MDEQQNAIAIAEIKGNMNAIRAENNAMESRIDASLARMQADMANFREDAAKRENRLIVTMAGMIALAIAILSAGFAFLAVLIGLPN